MAEERYQSERFADLAEQIIQTEPLVEQLKIRNFTIVFLECDDMKTGSGGRIFGKTEIIQEKNKWAIPGDVSVTIYEGSCRGFTDEQYRILMLHELLHIQVTGKNNDIPKIRPHDVQDFSEIIERFGRDWARIDENKLPGQMTLEDIDGKTKEEE